MKAGCTSDRVNGTTRGSGTQWRIRVLLLALALVGAWFAPPRATAAAALLMEEPFGQFGAFNPTGHAAVYLNHVCADGPRRLRVCGPGEHGVVISRYHKIDGVDWLAMPLIPYLYAVDKLADVPATITEPQEKALRAAYWSAHLQDLAPATTPGVPPGGEWIQLVGSSYDRKIHGFQVETTPEQDERFIAKFNDRKNVGDFNLFFHNCADFSRVVMNTYYPGAIHRSFVADLGLMTPKQAAKSLMKYGRKHPELQMTMFVIEQVPGPLPRSHAVDGVEESLVKSKKYIVPLIFFTPHIAGAAVVGYLAEGRLKLPKDAPVLALADDEVSEASGTVADEGSAQKADAQATAPSAVDVSGAPGDVPVVDPGLVPSELVTASPADSR